MRVLLINTNTFHYPWPVMPFGLCYVAAALERLGGHDVQLLDLCFAPDTSTAIEEAVLRFRPELAGLTIRNIDNAAGFAPHFLLDRVTDEVLRPLRRVFHGPIVIGGPAVGINAEEILQRLDLTMAIRGDGELAMVALADRLERGAPLDDVPGLVLREGDRIVHGEPPRPPGDLDRLPWPDLPRYIDIDRYARYGSPLQVQTKRGCELHCTYCTYRTIEGRRYRLRDPERVADEILDLVTRTGIRDIELTDSTFNVPLDHTKAVLRALLARRLRLELRTLGLNPGAVDEELVDLMARVGFRDVDLGAESASPKILRELGKSFTVEDLERAGRLLHDRGITLTWYLLVGAPGETLDTLRETLDRVAAWASPWDMVLVGVGLRAYNGAPLSKRLLRQRPETTSDNFLTPVVIEPEAVSLQRLALEVKRFCIEHPNFLLYNEEYGFPVESIYLSKRLMDWIAPGRPSWQVMIAARRVARRLGVSKLQRFLFEVSNLRRPYRPVGGYGPERFRGPR